MKRTMIGLVLLLTLAACDDRSVSELCQRIDNSCGSFDAQECFEDGEALADEAFEMGCDDEFDLHFACVEAAGCDWSNACIDERRTLDTCISR